MSQTRDYTGYLQSQGISADTIRLARRLNGLSVPAAPISALAGTFNRADLGPMNPTGPVSTTPLSIPAAQPTPMTNEHVYQHYQANPTKYPNVVMNNPAMTGGQVNGQTYDQHILPSDPRASSATPNPAVNNDTRALIADAQAAWDAKHAGTAFTRGAESQQAQARTLSQNPRLAALRVAAQQQRAADAARVAAVRGGAPVATAVAMSGRRGATVHHEAQIPTQVADLAAVDTTQAHDGQIFATADGKAARWDAPVGRMTQVEWNPTHMNWSASSAQQVADGRALEYSQLQEEKRREIKNHIVEVQADTGYTEEERADALRQLHGQLDGIKPLPHQQEKPSYPQGQDVGDHWTDSQTGAVLGRNSKGDLHVLVPPAKTEHSHDVTVGEVSQLIKHGHDVLDAVDPDTGKRTAASQDVINKYVRDAIDLQRELAGSSAGAPGGVPVGGSAPPPPEQRVPGQTQWTNPAGALLVWSDAGWVPQ